MNVTAGLGGMGGAQPLAITMNGGVALIAEVERWRIQKRIETKYCDLFFENIDDAIDRALEAKEKGEGRMNGAGSRETHHSQPSCLHHTRPVFAHSSTITSSSRGSRPRPWRACCCAQAGQPAPRRPVCPLHPAIKADEGESLPAPSARVRRKLPRTRVLSSPF